MLYQPPSLPFLLSSSLLPLKPNHLRYHLPHGAMDGSFLPAGIPGITDYMDPLEAVLGPFPCARLRGLPFDASLEDVLVFFQGLVVLDVVVVSSANSDGKGTGEAFVVFANPMDFQMALQRDRQNMGHRYIEVFQGKRSDYYAAIASVSEIDDVFPGLQLILFITSRESDTDSTFARKIYAPPIC